LRNIERQDLASFWGHFEEKTRETDQKGRWRLTGRSGRHSHGKRGGLKDEKVHQGFPKKVLKDRREGGLGTPRHKKEEVHNGLSSLGARTTLQAPAMVDARPWENEPLS